MTQPIQRTMTEGTQATPFGCCSFFDACNDQILSLYYRGQLDLLDWMGFNVTEECYRTVEFIDYVRPAQSGGADTVGYLAACADPNGVEFGSCKLTVEDFGRYGRIGPTRDIFKPTKYCKTRPRMFLDGTPVDSEFDWDLIFATDQLLNDIRKDLIVGDATTTGRFDGLQRWVADTYDCDSLNSYIVDWNSNDLDGANGTAAVTINGTAISGTWGFVDVLLDLYRNIKQRISWSPLLRNQTRRVGDSILLLPGFLGRALLDSFTCWSVCPGEANVKIVTLANKETREFRLSLNGGMFGHGKIYLDGDEIPLLFYDWELINSPTVGDIYFLTGSIGAQRVWEGEHLSAEIAMRQFDGVEGNPGDFWSRDGGRILGKVDVENTCRTLKAWMRPRLFCSAPWAQIRFQDVKAATPSGPLSPDPALTSFSPVSGSFNPATCP